MDAILYSLGAIAFALGAWDAFRRWCDANHARLLAHDKTEQHNRELSAVNLRLKLLEQAVPAHQAGIDECIVRLDTIKNQPMASKDQLRELEDHVRKELRGFDDELRVQFKRLETNEQAIRATSGQVLDLTAQFTAIQSVRPQPPRRMGA